MNKLILSLIIGLFSFTSHAGPITLNLQQAYDALTPELLEHYEAVIFVNISASGPHKQKAWVFERNRRGQFKLSENIVDKAVWDGSTDQTYSYRITSGRKYAGDKFSGPTLQGIFNFADSPTAWDPVRGTRTRINRGWGSPGMKDAVYIDLAYGSNRLSGQAQHGTPSGNYKVLGTTPDSHGCVRTSQQVSGDFLEWYTSFEKQPIPSFFSSTRTSGSKTYRTGYVRNGDMSYDGAGNIKTHMGYPVLAVWYSDAGPNSPLTWAFYR